ncbi:MAG: hypothetical protein DA408_06810 [Bacteroidetes bacterium]|nr:MAG: hypothetical protein C7N36_16005 [Bacteroidota bacterium]PTM13415.1 MAG: hypothetical protein DA408_06810 [Bacteroidota bacterium]
MKPFFTNDAIVFGILMMCLAFVFATSSSERKGWQRFYTFVPPILLCYFLPALLHWPLNLVAQDWFEPGIFDLARENGLRIPANASVAEIEKIFGQAGFDDSLFSSFKRSSGLYFVASRYLLPASLIWLCLSIDLKGIMRLGPKAIIMFLTATVGIIIGGPVALLLISYLFPNLIGIEPDQLWRGLSTIAGSWIGGGANQTAMKEIFEVPGSVFASMVVVDIVVANIWMGFLLYGAKISDRIDRWLKADNSAIKDLEKRVEDYQDSIRKIPTATEMYMLLAVGFGGVALSHWGADLITTWLAPHADGLKAAGMNSLLSGFFWLVVIATTIGLVLSFTRFRALEGVGASRWGSIFIYILVATIGMHMALGDVINNLGLFVIGAIWMLVHVALLLFVAWLIKAPFFFVAVGSQANVGGAASAPVVAAAFSPALAPVGVLMAVLGYALGTYGALICAYLMRYAAG